ncbi:MAG: hypothetical protein EOM72_12740 [Opitutae bacterium]|nr:hypothetical protein [Opitutae bacterium]
MDRSMGSMKTVGSGSRQAAGVAEDLSMGGAPTLRGGSPGRRFRAGEVILGRYRVTGELGQGGMGVVYRCFDETAGIEIALKALPPEVGHNSGEMDEVRENFRLVERLHHPNIAGVKTLEKDPASGDCYLIMECVDGLDLRQWARKRRGEGRPLTPDEIGIVAHRIAAALDYAHEQRVIHRDIKPANVRVNFEGDVKVLDFGLAAQLHTSMSRVSQAYRGTSGTGPYMAPEQWRGQRQDARADQYALAATVYELFAGAPPFESHDIGVLRAAVLSEPPPLLENVPPHVNAALLRGLAKEPGERFATCGELVKALGNANIKPQSAQRHGGKKVALMLAAAAAVVAMGYGAYRTYGTYSARRAEERMAAEQAEADRLAAEQRAREEKELQEKIAAALAAARAAKAAGQWQTCIERADEALALESGGRASPRAAVTDEAAALKREAEGNLVPTLTVEVEAGGRAVAAEISDGTRTYRAPHTFTLRADGRYSLVVSMESSQSNQSIQSTRYKPATLEVTADWRGPRTRKVALEEMRGPTEGQPWTSPATGMAFVWVPALKVWAGKHEATNGEYRKKEPGHDSREYGGHSLNGDRQPVVYVNFDDAKAYAAWLTDQEKAQLGGLRYRVISEKEWETVAQCGDGREYPWGNAMPPKYGNYCGQETKGIIAGSIMIDNWRDDYAVACPVEKSGANEWGLYGIGGNVWEGCASDNSGGSFGAWRGASWNGRDPGALRVADRIVLGGSDRDDRSGFRLALSR